MAQRVRARAQAVRQAVEREVLVVGCAVTAQQREEEEGQERVDEERDECWDEEGLFEGETTG